MVLKRKSSTKPRMRKPKRSFKPRRKFNRYTTSVYNSTTRPQKLIVKLPYFQSEQLASEYGSYVTQTFNLNSIYDPDRTGTGHQPLGRDQWITFYNKYRVFKVDYVITLTNADPAQPVDVCILNQNGVPSAADDSIFEQPGSFYVSLAPRDGSASRKVVKGSVYLPRLNGITPAQYKADENTSSAMSTSPSEVLTQSIIASPVITGSPVNLCYSVKYVYHCELFDPNQLMIS